MKIPARIPSAALAVAIAALSAPVRSQWPGRLPPIPGSAGSAATAAPAPGAGVPAAGAATATGALSPGGALGEDFGRWEFWWEFNKDRFLRVRDAVRAAPDASDESYMGTGEPETTPRAPTRAQIRELVRPALLQALDASRDRTIVMAALIALAKLQRVDPELDLVELVEPHLQRGDRAVRATAALALGISGDARATFPLIALMTDTPAGRDLLERDRVDEWTRTFAAYGLGCLARATDRLDVKELLFEVFRDVLRDGSPARRELRIGAVQALGALDPPRSLPGGERLFAQCVRELAALYRREAGPGEEIVQAHVPSAVANLARGAGGSLVVEWFEDLLVRELRARPGRTDHVRRAAVLALGVLADPCADASSEDADVAEVLWAEYRDGRDRHAAHFALVAAGQIGGAVHRDRLLEVLRNGSKVLDRPWAALGLGLLARRVHADPDSPLCTGLLASLRDSKHPDAVAASALALGLGGCTVAVPELRATLEHFEKRDLVAGCAGLALGMLGDEESTERLRALLEESTSRPELLRRTSVALGLLRDREAAPILVELLGDEAAVPGIASIAAALALVGDRATVDPLLAILAAEARTGASRSMAAAALGGIADPASLPWNEPFSANLNYLAWVETFANGSTGLLDIF